jgi:hypothetical protein
VQTIKSIDAVSGLAVQHTVLSSTLREAWEAALLQDITAAVKLPSASTTTTTTAATAHTAVPFELSLHLPGTSATTTTSSKVYHSVQQQQQQPTLSIEEVRLTRGTDMYATPATAVTRHDFVQCVRAQQQQQQQQQQQLSVSSRSSSPTRKLAGLVGSGKARWAASRAARLAAASTGTTATSANGKRGDAPSPRVVLRKVSAASAAAVDATAALQAAQPMSGGLDSIFDEGAEDVRGSL